MVNLAIDVRHELLFAILFLRALRRVAFLNEYAQVWRCTILLCTLARRRVFYPLDQMPLYLHPR